ncbi:hypothetical protein BC939DRAFT_454450 [Gamsiella multidivaricata]|uniref:uncharacterized protein n=1 Tax=Gamsiella multidivaricata TaxID=101098 RepID=UPI00221FD1B0|nr:uncharacterized protein BC939DRAFT_454450 [Gamsiella multidivaricata]KAI7821997.1 hypothetical protein BC939DRAFT_454450 [Gamsiella multidivaricata]
MAGRQTHGRPFAFPTTRAAPNPSPLFPGTTMALGNGASTTTSTTASTTASTNISTGFGGSGGSTTPVFVSRTTTTATPTLAFGARAIATTPTSASGSLFGSAAPTTPVGPTTTTAVATPAATGLFGTAATGAATAAATSTGLFGTAVTLVSKPGITPECIKSVRFRFQWNPLDVKEDKDFSQMIRFKANSAEDYQFECSVKRIENCYLFRLICPAEKDFTSLKWVTSATIQMSDIPVSSNFLPSWPDSRMISISGPIEVDRFSKDLYGFHNVYITLSDAGLFEFYPKEAKEGMYGHCDFILERLLDDCASHDVFFEFEVPGIFGDPPSENDCEDFDEVGDEEVKGELDGTYSKVKKEDEEQKLKGESSSEAPNEKGKKSTEDKKGKSVASSTQSHPVYRHARSSRRTTLETVGAHKIILSHFEYFKTMFSSSFAEGGPGVKRIKITDTDIYCFRLLIQFLYLGRLRTRSIPICLTEDQAKDHLPTWEDVYLVADRYNISELRRMAVSRILFGLQAKWAVPFLFRTAYLFDDLRAPLIKYVVQNCMASIVTKETQATYENHVECSAIFGEIITELWATRKN